MVIKRCLKRRLKEKYIVIYMNRIKIKVTGFIFLVITVHGSFFNQFKSVMSIFFKDDDINYKKFEVFLNTFLRPNSELYFKEKEFINYSKELQQNLLIIISETLKYLKIEVFTEKLLSLLEKAEIFFNNEYDYIDSCNNLKIVYDYSFKFLNINNLIDFDITETDNTDTANLLITYN